MDNAQAYLTKVLRSCSSEVEGFLSEKNTSRLSQMITKIEKAKIVDEELKRIYRVTGLESFALTCMWITDRSRKSGIKDEEYEADRERIARTLSPFIEWDEELPPVPQAKPATTGTKPASPVPAGNVAPSVPADTITAPFLQSLEVLIMQLKESSEDPDAFENAFDHLQEVCEEKSKELLVLNNPSVNDFVAVLTQVLQVATTKKIRNSPKVIDLLTATANNLEKIVGTGTKFDISGLKNQTTAMRTASRSL